MSDSNAKVRRKRRYLESRYLALYLMTLPGLVYLIINNYIPMGGIVIAFKNINWRKGIIASPFVGLKNFEFLFKTRDAWLITRNTLLYNVAFIAIGMFLAVFVAIVLNEIRSKLAKKAYQTIYLLPYLISIVVVSYLVYAFLSIDSGFVNKKLLPVFGREPIAWYTKPQYWPAILIFVHTWKTFGYDSILYYTTLVGVDPSLYEASVIDGANRWQQVKYITLPSLRPVMITLTLLAIGRIFYSDFGLFYQVPMDSGPLIDVTNTIDTYVYRALIQLNDYGMSSAASVYQSLIGFVLVLGANMVVRKLSRENALF